MITTAKNKAKKAVNEALHAIGLRYHDGLPIKEIIDLLHANGFGETDELVGIYCGKNGNIIPTHVGDGLYLALSWYKMEQTGRYEVTAYLS